MLTYWIRKFLMFPVAIILIPIQLVSTFVLGILVSITFGLLLVPLSLIYVLMIGPLLGLSWVATKIRFTRDIVGLIGLPLSMVAEAYTALMPSMGELENRAAKMLLVRCYPYSWEFLRFQNGRLDIDSPEAASFQVVLMGSATDALTRRVVAKLALQEPLY